MNRKHFTALALAAVALLDTNAFAQADYPNTLLSG